MKTISRKEILEIKKKGGKVNVGEAPAKKQAPKKSPNIEKSFESLNEYVKQIITKKDNTQIIMQSAETISTTLLKVVDKIDKMQKTDKIKAWDINVSRDKDKLIKTLTMKAG